MVIKWDALLSVSISISSQIYTHIYKLLTIFLFAPHFHTIPNGKSFSKIANLGVQKKKNRVQQNVQRFSDLFSSISMIFFAIEEKNEKIPSVHIISIAHKETDKKTLRTAVKPIHRTNSAQDLLLLLFFILCLMLFFR